MDITRTDVAARALEKALDGLSLRSQAISHNVANVDTPNFKRSEVHFEQDLQAALRRPAGGVAMAITNGRHLGTAAPATVDAVTARAVPLANTTLRNDGNNVDMDREMARLAETQLGFQAAAQLMNTKFHHLRQAIWEGRK
jgi:flagellar basal-body rod protein FlgB